MSVNVTVRPNRNGTKQYYTLEWGKLAGQRMSTGIFTYTRPKNIVEKNHNKEALAILDAKKSQMILDSQSIANGYTPRHKLKENFLDFYGDYVKNNRFEKNRSLPCSLTAFKKFIKPKFGDFISPIDITEDFCKQFRAYLLANLTGETPADYFMRFKRMLKAAKKQGYFRESPAEDLAAKGHPPGEKEVLTTEEYLILMNAYCSNYEVKKAAVTSMYTGFRWCDIEVLEWWQIKENTIVLRKQSKTGVPLELPLHPIVKQILGERKAPNEKVFSLPTADGANKVLKNWVRKEGKIDKHITWHCLRHSVSDILQNKGVDVATVAGVLGHKSSKYVLARYKKRVLKHHTTEAINNLPTEHLINPE